MRRIYRYLALALALSAAGAAETYTGVDHRHDVRRQASYHVQRSHGPGMRPYVRQRAVRLCARGWCHHHETQRSEDSGASIAAQKVKVTGTYDAKSNTIKVDFDGSDRRRPVRHREQIAMVPVRRILVVRSGALGRGDHCSSGARGFSAREQPGAAERGSPGGCAPSLCQRKPKLEPTPCPTRPRSWPTPAPTGPTTAPPATPTTAAAIPRWERICTRPLPTCARAAPSKRPTANCSSSFRTESAPPACLPGVARPTTRRIPGSWCASSVICRN